jgi:hypothetical protein
MRLVPVAFVLVAFLGLLSIEYLFGFYQKRVTGIAELGRSTIAKWDFSDDHRCPVEHHSQQHDGELWRSSASNHADLQRLREWRRAGECGYGRNSPRDCEALAA